MLHCDCAGVEEDEGDDEPEPVRGLARPAHKVAETLLRATPGALLASGGTWEENVLLISVVVQQKQIMLIDLRGDRF